MKEPLTIETERTDDLPLLVMHMQRMQLASLLDKHFPTHGLRKELSMGELSVVWLTHVLSQADHRMNQVQEWASRRLTTLRGCGLESLTPLDMTDDRLADVLRLLSNDERYQAFEQKLMGHLVRVYALDASCVRLDTTTVSSYTDVNDEGLLHLGHSYETLIDMEVAAGERTICWQERRLIIQSSDARQAAQIRLQERLEKAEKAIEALMVRKQGMLLAYACERTPCCSSLARSKWK